MTWQPIETAPTKGQRFLAIQGKDQFICQWGYHYQRSLTKGNIYGWVNCHGQAGNVARPTHWMPLPSPPQDDTKE